jgi:glycosyltransferase involved in cell wall biosynthesis
MIGNIGTFTLLKGQDILIKAFEGLSPEEQERYEVVFVGQDDQYHSEIVEETHRFIESRGNVTAYGWMDQEKLYALMKTWNLLVVPSRLESLSAVAIEAMAMEIPVVCSSACGISRYIENGKNGWIFESENIEQLQEILQKVLRQPELLEQVGKQGREVYMNHFSRNALENMILPIIGHLYYESE